MLGLLFISLLQISYQILPLVKIYTVFLGYVIINRHRVLFKHSLLNMIEIKESVCSLVEQH